ncbi:MAG: hypothetical protein ABII64_00725 [Elusimicrobiota bacterium]
MRKALIAAGLVMCAGLLAAQALADDAIILKRLFNLSAFKENDDWKISYELTRDLRKALSARGFRVADHKNGQNTEGKTVIEGEISEFELGQQEYDSMPLVSYKGYKASLKITLRLLGPATGWATELKSEYEETSKKLRSFLPGPDESELANDKIMDFETRGQVKWGAPEFRKSVAGIVAEKVVNDLSSQINTIIRSRPAK